jgi:hypothetical protein
LTLQPVVPLVESHAVILNLFEPLFGIDCVNVLSVIMFFRGEHLLSQHREHEEFFLGVTLVVNDVLGLLV